MSNTEANNLRLNPFAVHIRTARLKQDWSIAQAAAHCGYSEQQWRNFESGRQRPQVTRLGRLCKHLQLDSLGTFILWSTETLSQPENLQLAQRIEQLARPNQTESTDGVKSRRGVSSSVLDNILDTISFDDPTADFATQIIGDVIEAVRKYRNRLVRPTRPGKSVQIKTLEQQNQSWSKFPGSEATAQSVVCCDRNGLGFIATVVRVEPGNGIFHIHLEGPYVSGGMEFFALLEGNGHLIVSHPRSKEWIEKEIRPGTVGSYPGNCGHAFINTSDFALRIFLVAVPFPPPLQAGPPSSRNRGTGSSNAVEFTLNRLSKAKIPIALRQAITALLSSEK